MLKKKVINDAANVVLNSTVSQLTGARVNEGLLYGLELELEGRGVAMDGVPSKNWRRVDDGSLRGESVEYVFTAPCDYDEAVKRVTRLFNMFNKHGVKLANSYRTSTHVHLNFSDKIGKQVVNFFLLHTIIEEILEYYCGDLRKGNLFCLSCRDNEELVDILRDCIFKYGGYQQFNNEVRYNAANLAALNKFGTIELRTMRGVNSAEEILEWLEIVKPLYEFACSPDCPPPWRLVESLSHLGVERFLQQIFSQKIVDKLLRHWPPVRDVRLSLMEGVRLVQMLAYQLEEPWFVNPPKPAPAARKEVKQMKDPFGRDILEPAVWLNNDRLADNLVNRGPHPHDEVRTDDGRSWIMQNVRLLRPGQQFHVWGTLCYFDEQDMCVREGANNKPLRWSIFNGTRIRPGTRLDRRVNRKLRHWPVEELDPVADAFNWDADIREENDENDD